jgi:ABC-type uncharacterized transport system substrate-binding protein
MAIVGRQEVEIVVARKIIPGIPDPVAQAVVARIEGEVVLAGITQMNC